MLSVKQEFRDLIPPLSGDERRDLEESIILYGCRDAIVVWRGVIIDGHNRFEICERNGILFQTLDMTEDFETEDEVKQWIIRNQFARRNIDKYQRSVLALQLKEMIAGRAKENQKQYFGNQHDGGLMVNLPEVQNDDGLMMNSSNVQNFAELENSSSANLPKMEPINTRGQLAKIAGVSEQTIDRVEAIETEAPELIKQAARDNVVSINKAYEITKAVQDLPKEEQIDEATRLMNERTRAADREIDRRHNLAKSFAHAVEGIGSYRVREEDLQCYLEYSPQMVIDDLVRNCDRGIANLQEIKAMYTSLRRPRAVKY